MKVLKYSGAFLAVVFLLLVFVVKFSAVESRFQCAGSISSEGSSRPAIIYLKLEKYRWWVGLWGKSAGAISIEIPNEIIEYYANVEKAGDQLQIFDSQKKLKGNFSELSDMLAISTPVGFFDGSCKEK